MDTVAAIATPPGTGGLSVIRISGPDAIRRAAEIFRPASGRDVCTMSGYTCAYGHILRDGEILDDCVLTVFRAPHSYTGEDTAELSCHGGRYLTEQVLRVVLCDTVVPAPPGEFTKRAFLNGKLSLTQAEAVQDLIAAQGEASLRCARDLREGATFRRIRALSDTLLTVLSDLAVWANYPDEDIPGVDGGALGRRLEALTQEMQALLATYESGRILREGLRCTVVGRPNVGKSTLFNVLAGSDRSIVTDIAGTTRDVIEEQIRVGSVTLTLSDTAGVRETQDPVERLGVERSRKALQKADLVLCVLDAPPASLPDLDPSRTIVVLNKSDHVHIPEIPGFRCIRTCAATGEGCDALANLIEDFAARLAPASDEGMIANERQRECLVRALDAVREGADALALGLAYDAVTVSLDGACQALLELSGERVTDRVVDTVFSRFCVGK